MAKDKPPTLGERMKEARLATAVRMRETVSQDRMARLVGKVVGRPIKQATWSTYELDTLEPPLDVIAATSFLSGLSGSYIAFGDASESGKDGPYFGEETGAKKKPAQKRGRSA